MTNGIDLTKPLLHSICGFYFISNFQAKLYHDKIELGLKLLDLVYSDVTDPFTEGLYGATHLVTFFIIL